MRRSLLTSLVALVVSAPAAAQSTAEFWQQLGDTALARLTGEALQANQDLVRAQARVRLARAARTTSALDLAPVITVGGGYTRQRTSEASFGLEVPERSLWDAGLNASWELDLFGRLRKNLRGRNALVGSAELDRRDLERTLAAELATAYFDLRGAQDRHQVATRNAENQRRTLALTRSRLDAGRGTAFDTERAQAQLSTTLATIPRLQLRIAAAGHRIGVLVGRDPEAVAAELPYRPGPDPDTGTDTPLGCPVPELPAELVTGDVEVLIRNRPDVRAAEQRFAAERAFAGSAKADYLPRLAIGGTAGFTSTEFDGFGRNGTGRYAVGPVVSWPLFNLGRVKAGVDAARALASEAEAQYQQTVLLAREELATARAGYAMSRERLAQLEAAALASSRAADLARLRFTGGVADFLQVLDAERSLLAAQDQLAEGRTDLVTALVAVYRAAGPGK